MAAVGAAVPSAVSRRRNPEPVPTQRNATTRICKEAALMESSPPPGCSAKVAEDDMYMWSGCIDGPDNSAYAGGKFRFRLDLPPDYPYSPPRMFFETKVYHPNIKSTSDDSKTPFGIVCIDILQKDKGWSPTLTIEKILLSVMSLLTDPNPDHPLEHEIARECKHKRERYERKAKEYTELYAIEK